MIFNVDANLKNKTNYINLNHKWTVLYDCHSNLFVSRQVIKTLHRETKKGTNPITIKEIRIPIKSQNRTSIVRPSET